MARNRDKTAIVKLGKPKTFQIWELFSTRYNRIGRNALSRKMKLMKRTYKKEEKEEKT